MGRVRKFKTRDFWREIGHNKYMPVLGFLISVFLMLLIWGIAFKIISTGAYQEGTKTGYVNINFNDDPIQYLFYSMGKLILPFFLSFPSLLLFIDSLIKLSDNKNNKSG